ncbi:MAG: serine/threonine protein kinase, partial [Nannocystaceae bacterium]|nr:serine/threonine protein kinase [Nannocystaceae bacterium]
MGVVYAARDPMLHRDIAIKVLTTNRAGDEGMVRARREAQAMAQLSHPNVVKVFAIGEHDGALYIAMERILGDTLRQWQSAPRAPDEVLAVYRQAARGLAELHEHGLVHRDFKPANAMIGEDGRVRVLDLGLVTELARAASSEEISLGSGGSLRDGAATRSDAFLGTPAYMSPEQFLGEPVTAASDQFSFCVALHEALYGHRPFKAKSMTQLVEAICEERIEPPKSDSAVPRRVLKALRRGLSRDPERRHASMEALLRALGGGSRSTAWMMGVAAAGLVALGIAGTASARNEPCPTSTRMHEVWSPQAKARLMDGLSGEQDACLLYTSDAADEAR